MARPLGIEFPGAVYHVISRGNEKGCTRSSCPGYLRAGRQRDWVCYERVLGEFGRDADSG